MLSMKRLLGAWLAMAALSASATGLESLEAFIKTARSGRADFVQVVTAPAKDAEAPRSKTSSGSFEISRPNRFKFV